MAAGGGGVLLALRSPALIARRDLAGVSRGMWLFALRAIVGLLAMVATYHIVRKGMRDAYDVGAWHGHAAEAYVQAYMAERLGPDCFRVTAFFQLSLVLLIAPLRSLSVLSLERSRGTLGLLALTPIGAVRAVGGKILSSAAFAIAIAAILSPVALATMGLGGVSSDDLVSVGLGALELSLLGAALGGAAALLAARPVVASGLLGLGGTILYGIAPAYVGLPALWHPLTLFGVGMARRGDLDALLLFGLPVQIAAFFALSLLLAPRTLAGTGGRARRRRYDRNVGDLGVIGCIAIAFGVPLVLVVPAELFLGLDVSQIWFFMEGAFIYLGATFLGAIALSKERQAGTMSLLLATPRRGDHLYVASFRPVALFLGGSAALMYAHLAFHARVVESLGDGLITWALPLQVAALGFLAGVLSHAIGSITPSIFAALAWSSGGAIAIALGSAAFHLVGDFPDLSWNPIYAIVGALFYRPSGPSAAPILAGLGALLLLVGASLFRSLQTRFPARSAAP